MSTKTENPANVGKHKFEVAGLGAGPFRFTHMEENVITYPDGTTQAGGCCDYCFTGIRYEFHIVSKDGKRSKVGCDCIAKVGDEGLLKAYKTSKQWRDLQAYKRAIKAAKVRDELTALIGDSAATLAVLPHPRGFTDRQTHQPMTALDYYRWHLENAGASGRDGTLRELKRHLAAIKTS